MAVVIQTLVCTVWSTTILFWLAFEFRFYPHSLSEDHIEQIRPISRASKFSAILAIVVAPRPIENSICPLFAQINAQQRHGVRTAAIATESPRNGWHLLEINPRMARSDILQWLQKSPRHGWHVSAIELRSLWTAWRSPRKVRKSFVFVTMCG